MKRPLTALEDGEMGMKKPSKVTLSIRALVAVYLLYLAYELIRDYDTSQNQMVITIGIVVFIVCGAIILVSSVRRLVKGDYDEGSGAE